VPAVRAPNGSDFARMARRSEPVVNCSADGAATDRRLTGTMMAGDQEQETFAACDRLIERAVDCPPCPVEGHSVEINDAVRFQRSAAESPVPASVERRARCETLLPRGRTSRARCCRYCWLRGRLRRHFSYLRVVPLTRQWPDRGSDARPELGFLRVEGAHVPPPLWGGAGRRHRWRTFRRRFASRPVLNPRRCRTGSRP